MWTMAICCVVPILILLFAGGKLSGGGYLWQILIGAFVVGHIWMMFKGHGGHKDGDTEDTSNTASDKPKDRHKEDNKHGGCCH